MTPFTLTIHPTSPKSLFEVKGMLSRYQNELSIGLTILGPTQDIRLTPVPAPLSRSHELWLSTCFEIFLKNPKGEDYLELNLAPNGAWNWYYFPMYRSSSAGDAVEYNPVNAPSLTHSGHGSEQWRINGMIPLPKEIPWLDHVGGARMSVNTILKLPSSLEYFSTHHADIERADFHHPQSMTIII